MTSEIILITIPYCTIYYLLYQEFLTVCVYLQSIAGLLIVLAIPQFNYTYCHHIFIVSYSYLYQIFSNASSTTYHIIYISSYSYSLVLFVPIYRIDHLLEPWRHDISMLESATHFALVLLLGRFSYQLPISGHSFFVVIVSSTPLSYF